MNMYEAAEPTALLSPELAARIFASMNTHQHDYADIFVADTLFEHWHLEEGRVKSASFSTTRGAGLRAVYDDKTAFASVDSCDANELIQAAKTIAAMGRQGQNGHATFKSVAACQTLYGHANPALSMDDDAKVALLRGIDAKLRAADPRVVEVSAALALQYEVIALARLDGRMHDDCRPLVRLSLQVVVEEKGRREQGVSGGGARANLDYFSAERVAEYCQQALHQALMNLEAVAAPAGEMTVVLAAGWPGILLHEAVGHGLEGDFNRKGTSVFSQRLGTQVAAAGVTVIDQGNIPGRRGSLNMDDEGNPTQATVLIENGVLVGYMQDEMNARLMNMAVTGNGRRESYAHCPMPRMTNTFMQNGSMDPSEIIASVKKGIYAVQFGGGQVDITAGQFVFSASEAWLIERGQLIHPIKGATLIGNGAKVLQHVTMIGHDCALDSGVGTCGKNGQSVPVGVGQPTLRIDAGLTVGGSFIA